MIIICLMLLENIYKRTETFIKRWNFDDVSVENQMNEMKEKSVPEWNNKKY